MNIFFRAKQRTPAELARALRDALERLGVAETPVGLVLVDVPDSKRSEDAVRCLQQAKLVLYGDGGAYFMLTSERACARAGRAVCAGELRSAAYRGAARRDAAARV